jgi:hypothetical protein
MSVYRLIIPGWLPATVNQLLKSVKARIRLKKADRQIVSAYARMANIPPAVVRRRVSLHLTLMPRVTAADVDAYWKSLLDALVYAGLIVDDNRQHCELGEVTYDRGPVRGARIVLEDLPAVPRR